MTTTHEYLRSLARVSAALLVQGKRAEAEGGRLAAYHFALRRGALGDEYDLFLRFRHDQLAPIMHPHDWTECGNDGTCRKATITTTED